MGHLRRPTDYPGAPASADAEQLMRHPGRDSGDLERTAPVEASRYPVPKRLLREKIDDLVRHSAALPLVRISGMCGGAAPASSSLPRDTSILVTIGRWSYMPKRQ